MKKTLMAAATAALLGMGGAATAADMYHGGGLKDVPAYVPPPLWTGFYIGGHMGIAWSQLDLNDHVFTACDDTGSLQPIPVREGKPQLHKRLWRRPIRI